MNKQKLNIFIDKVINNLNKYKMKSKEYFKEYQLENQDKSPEWRLVFAFRKMVLEVSDIAKMRNAKYDSALCAIFKEQLLKANSFVKMVNKNKINPPYCKARVMPSKISTMKDFNSQQAKQIVDSLYTDKLHNILVDIKSKAEQGETVLHIYKPIKGNTVDTLRNKGFKVTDYLSIVIQRDSLYYSIYWA